MIGRVTQQGMQQSSLQQLQNNLSQMSVLQERLNTGKVITKPSDDPAGAVDAMRVRADQRATAQYVRNAQDGESWLTTIDTALLNSSSLIRSARDLAVRGASGALSATAREAIATEMRSIADGLVEEANTKYLGRNVFAGTSSAEEVYTKVGEGASTKFLYLADESSTDLGEVRRRVSDTTTVRVDSDGAAVFGKDEDSVFALIYSVADMVEGKTDGDVSAALGDIDAHLDNVLQEIGSVGARTNEILRAKETLASREVTLESMRSSVEDADLAETIVNLQMQEVSYQAALGATARVLQPSLLDFLR